MTPLVINFHGIGDVPQGTPADEAPYWLSRAAFEQAIALLQSQPKPFRVSFDDGNTSDLAIGVPFCAERGVTAMVFACTGRIGQPGYLGAADLRELADFPGCSVGSHGADHVPWRMADDAALAVEVAGSKARLESVLGQAVDSVGLPMGSYDRRVLAAVRSAGYREIYSSDGGPRLLDGVAAVRPRRGLRSDRPLDVQVARICAAANWHAAALQELRVRLKSSR